LENYIWAVHPFTSYGYDLFILPTPSFRQTRRHRFKLSHPRGPPQSVVKTDSTILAPVRLSVLTSVRLCSSPSAAHRRRWEGRCPLHPTPTPTPPRRALRLYTRTPATQSRGAEPTSTPTLKLATIYVPSSVPHTSMPAGCPHKKHGRRAPQATAPPFPYDGDAKSVAAALQRPYILME
jgi:hypothetical protein